MAHTCTMAPLSAAEPDEECLGEEAMSADVLRPLLRPPRGCASRTDCSGHGDCGAGGVCRCDAGWFAPDCSFECDDGTG